jgi:hypothetical protein
MFEILNVLYIYIYIYIYVYIRSQGRTNSNVLLLRKELYIYQDSDPYIQCVNLMYQICVETPQERRPPAPSPAQLTPNV